MFEPADWPAIVAFVALCLVVIAGAWTDVRDGKVYNRLTYPAMLFGLVWWTSAGLAQGGLAGAWYGATLAFIGLMAGLIPFGILVFVFGGLGGGDAKLMGAVGSLSASWLCVVHTTVYAMLVALVMAIFIMIQQRVARQTFQRLYGAVLMSIARVRPNLEHEDSPTVAFALALAVGAILGGVQVLLGWQPPWAAYV